MLLEACRQASDGAPRYSQPIHKRSQMMAILMETVNAGGSVRPGVDFAVDFLSHSLAFSENA